jgi:type IV pilus assembly protein PilE
MRLNKNKSGFTLLEIIIVIIIVGVLASLALPRFFRTVEYSRGTEALTNLSAIRQATERYYLQRSTYVGVAMGNLDIDDPSNSPNSHFGSYGFSGLGATTYTITATRNTRDGGTAGDTVVLTNNGATITRSGTTAFVGVQ